MIIIFIPHMAVVVSPSLCSGRDHPSGGDNRTRGKPRLGGRPGTPWPVGPGPYWVTPARGDPGLGESDGDEIIIFYNKAMYDTLVDSVLG